jgi:hypothetical protein
MREQRNAAREDEREAERKRLEEAHRLTVAAAKRGREAGKRRQAAFLESLGFTRGPDGLYVPPSSVQANGQKQNGTPGHTRTPKPRPRLPRGSSFERGYGPDHRRLRKQLVQAVEAGELVLCVRCGDPILPGTKVDLGHVDGSGKTLYSGLEHASCNRSAGGRLGNAIKNGGEPRPRASRDW